jgi:hypothetical protein
MALLLGVYHLFLEREKMHRFNRYFLLFSLVFSLTIPLLTINWSVFSAPDYQLSAYVQEAESRTLVSQVPQSRQSPADNVAPAPEPNTSFNYFQLLLFGYLSIAGVLAMRFIRNVYQIISTIYQHPCRTDGDIKLVLVGADIVPHSFFNYIFVHKKAYKSGDIDPAILTHEQTHARQKHSLDIMFIEMLKILLWFNPVVYFYKKAIQLNHEYLADEAVIAQSQNRSQYQQLLLNMNGDHQNFSLVSSIQYSIIKKRFIMMTKQSNNIRTTWKQLAVIPLLAGLLFAFSTNHAEAQDLEQMSISELIDAINTKIESAESLSDQEMEQLQTLISKIQDQLRKQQPPPPPKPVKPPKPKQQDPPPVPIPADVDSTEYIERAKEYGNQMRAYSNITPSPQNRAELEKSYANLPQLYDQLTSIYRELKKENIDVRKVAPPLMNPADRMQVYYRQNWETMEKDTAILNRVSKQYAYLLDKYSQISPVSEGNLKYRYKQLRIMYDNWHKIFEETKGMAKLRPLPSSPETKIKAYNSNSQSNELNKSQKAELDKLSEILDQKTMAYKNIAPDSANIDKLNKTYHEMMAAYDNFVERQQEFLGEDAPPGPPVIRKPSWRIRNNK